MTRIKVCGVKTYQDALGAARAGSDMLGLNFYPPSPRYITLVEAKHIARGLRRELGAACPLFAGVFVNESPEKVLDIVEAVGLDLAQLSGDESAQDLVALKGRAIKAIRPRSQAEALHLASLFLPHAPKNERLPALLLDAYHPDLYGGTGEQASKEVSLAVKALTPRLMLAGGLTPENVAERMADIQPWGVDVASGVEGPEKGRKDPVRIEAFIMATRINIKEG